MFRFASLILLSLVLLLGGVHNYPLSLGPVLTTQVNSHGSPAYQTGNQSYWVYRALFEIDTTSDWTNVHLRIGADIANARMNIVEGANAPNLSTSLSLSDNGIIISKKQYDPTKVSLSVPAVLYNFTGGEITFEIQKGCMGFTTLTVYNYNGVSPTNIALFSAGPSDCNFPGPMFSISATRLMQGGPVLSLGPRATGEFGRLVWAFYYPWYSPETWDKTQPPMLIDKPLNGPYDSSDPKVIEQHIRMAKSAGIDGFITSWGNYPPGSPLDPEDINLRTLLDVASRNNFKVTIYFESFPPRKQRTCWSNSYATSFWPTRKTQGTSE